MSRHGPLAVLGAINEDLVISGAALPRPGQTVVGGSFATHHGGKGGNQAVAAARAGAHVAMIGAVGDDALGKEAVEALRTEGIDVSSVQVQAEPTGVALIAVDAKGENQIAVAPGANNWTFDPAEPLAVLAPSLVLMSCEVPYAALSSATRWCRENGVGFIVNPAPSSPRLRNLLDGALVATPNRDELTELSPGHQNAEEAALALASRIQGLAILVTLGPKGALLVHGGEATPIAAPEVEVVDTTGAGDCLNGALAAALWEGMDLEGGAARAVEAATLSVTVAGARGAPHTGEAP
jgi:ribokinase